MGTATATLTIDNFPTGIENTQHLITVRGTVAISASPDTYAAGGLALSWVNELIKSNSVHPIDAKFYSVGLNGSTVGGFLYQWNKASDTLQVLAASGGTAGTGAVGEEMTDATAIPAAISNDVIRFEAKFVRSYNS